MYSDDDATISDEQCTIKHAKTSVMRLWTPQA